MARPSQNLDRALLEAGFAEVKRVGVRGLSVRAVCARAGVNVRMLNYHFGSKDEFVRQLLTKTYEYFFNALSSSVQQAGPPLERMERALRLIVRFAVENRALMRNLWMDANAGVPLVLDMLRQYGFSDIQLLYGLLIEAREVGDLRRDIPARQIFMAVIPGVFAPLMWREWILPLRLASHNHELFNDEDEPVDEDPVETAIRNFTCLLEGFRVRPTDDGPCSSDRARTEASPGRADHAPPTSNSRKGGPRSRAAPDTA